MKFSILIQMVFDLLSKRKAPAKYFAEKYSIAERTVYRYVDCIALCVPVYVKRGRNGGICLSDSYKLPIGFMTKEEYETLIEGLTIAYAHNPKHRFLNVQHKLHTQLKHERKDNIVAGKPDNLLVDGGIYGTTLSMSATLQLFRESMQERHLLEIVYRSIFGEKTTHKIEPYLLLYKQNVWYAYTFCRTTRAFCIFRLGRILSITKTSERFIARPFRREDVAAPFHAEGDKLIDVRLAVKDTAFIRVQDVFGFQALSQINGVWYADVSLPAKNLPATILSLGSDVRVVFPDELKRRVQQLAQSIANAYVDEPLSLSTDND